MRIFFTQDIAHTTMFTYFSVSFIFRVFFSHFAKMQYLQVNDNGTHFVKDVNAAAIFNKIKLWDIWTKDKVGDEKTEEWFDEDIDVSFISPSLLFAVIYNSTSTGLQPFIGYNWTFEHFSKSVVEQMKNYLLKDIKKPNGLLFLDAIDVDYLHRTGKIKSKKYNQYMAKKGNVIVFHENVLNCIQAIVQNLKLHSS